jgi:class 3 adenylate cyclase
VWDDARVRALVGRWIIGVFMDRHDLDGVSAADLAAAHLSDLEIQGRHGVRFLSYWYDYGRNAAFCLVDAPDAEAAQAVHRDAHGSIANEIIPVDPDEVERFLGRVDDPVLSGREAESAFRIILFTDLEGSTELVQRLGDDGAMRLLRIHDGIIRAALARHAGREVKHTGDGIMASFGSVQAALAGAVAIQQGFAEHNASDPEHPLRVRIGMSAGEPVAEGGDLFGAAVQLAARLCDRAGPCAIAVSTVVRDLAIGKGFTFGPSSEASLKGFPVPVSLCELRWSETG